VDGCVDADNQQAEGAEVTQKPQKGNRRMDREKGKAVSEELDGFFFACSASLLRLPRTGNLLRSRA
jgi:hypothetical protein